MIIHRKQPLAVDAHTPRIARLFVVNWAKHNSFEYDFFQTPKGPIIFYTKDRLFWLRCSWKSKHFRHISGRDTFITELAEELAIAFGWKK